MDRGRPGLARAGDLEPLAQNASLRTFDVLGGAPLDRAELRALFGVKVTITVDGGP